MQKSKLFYQFIQYIMNLSVKAIDEDGGEYRCKFVLCIDAFGNILECFGVE